MVDLTNLTPERRSQYDEWPAIRRRYNQQCFLPAEKVKLTYLIVNKCGVTSATKYIRDFHKIQTMGTEQYKASRYYTENKVVAMWRDPFKRIESTYRWSQRTRPAEPEFFPDWRLPFCDWIPTLCAEPGDSWYDEHVASQTFLNTHPLGRMPDVLIPWDWPRLWNMFRVSRPGEPINTSDPGISTPWSDENREMFAEWAAEDITTWNKLHEVK